MIVVSNVERNQFKFFDLRVTLKKLCKIIDTFCYAFSENHRKTRRVRQDGKQDLSIGPLTRWKRDDVKQGRTILAKTSNSSVVASRIDAVGRLQGRIYSNYDQQPYFGN